jgi:hypothetical protein
MPPGPVTLKLTLRTHALGYAQTIFDSSEPVLSLFLNPDGTLSLVRSDPDQHFVALNGEAPLKTGQWHEITAVFTGSELRLYIDGQPDGSTAAVCGTRGNSCCGIGGFCGVHPLWQRVSASGRQKARNFHGDMIKLAIKNKCSYILRCNMQLTAAE